jgi:cytoskeletal protein CcmA (bactofilin family)
MAKNDKLESAGKQTTVEEGTQFKGTLSSNCPVLVRGVVDGDLTAPSVIVSESGSVTGNVKAECIRSEGVIAGRVDADDVYLSGSVRSDTMIRAKNLEVKLERAEGKLQVTFGECILDIGDDPSGEMSDGLRMQNKREKRAADQSGSEDESTKRRSVPPMS